MYYSYSSFCIIKDREFKVYFVIDIDSSSYSVHSSLLCIHMIFYMFLTFLFSFLLFVFFSTLIFSHNNTNTNLVYLFCLFFYVWSLDPQCEAVSSSLSLTTMNPTSLSLKRVHPGCDICHLLFSMKIT